MRYVSHENLYRRRYNEGAGLSVEPAIMRTGDPHDPTTPGVVLRSLDFQILACLTLEHAHRLHAGLTAVLTENTDADA